MATRKIYDLAVTTGSYTDRDGMIKNRYQTVGAMLEREDGGKFLILERWFNPAGVTFKEGSSSVILSMFEPRDDKQGQAPQQQPTQAPRQQQAAPQSAPQQRQPARPMESPNAGLPHANDFSDDIPF